MRSSTPLYHNLILSISNREIFSLDVHFTFFFSEEMLELLIGVINHAWKSKAFCQQPVIFYPGSIVSADNPDNDSHDNK